MFSPFVQRSQAVAWCVVRFSSWETGRHQKVACSSRLTVTTRALSHERQASRSRRRVSLPSLQRSRCAACTPTPPHCPRRCPKAWGRTAALRARPSPGRSRRTNIAAGAPTARSGQRLPPISAAPRCGPPPRRPARPPLGEARLPPRTRRLAAGCPAPAAPPGSSGTGRARPPQ